MSALFASLPIAVLATSLMGSAHCAAMCGPLVLSVARSPRALIAYHLGRLASYGILGALAGALGAGVVDLTPATWMSRMSSALIAAVLILFGISLWRGRGVSLFRIPPRRLAGVQRASGFRPGVTGFLSAFLPCGWLHTFVVGAVAT
ncbi:MAG TPA: sulfite exporter TauE/SafE family protein, partial [Bdellovibrionota bacterium]|nr:sulfite exporter TauE/SafE family protein [Bdellovibrionota bacterium]